MIHRRFDQFDQKNSSVVDLDEISPQVDRIAVYNCYNRSKTESLEKLEPFNRNSERK